MIQHGFVNSRGALLAAWIAWGVAASTSRADDQPVGALAAQPAAAPGAIVLSLIDGRTIEMKLNSIAGNRLTGTTRDGPFDASLDDILRINCPPGDIGTARDFASRLAIQLADGGYLLGDFGGEAPPAPGVIRVSIGLGTPVEIKFASIAGLKFQAVDQPEIERDFQSRVADRKPGRDTMLLIKDGKPLAVQGSLEKLGPSGWEFNFGGKARTGDLANVYGFVFGAPAVAPAAPPASVVLSSGNRLGASIVAADGESLTILTETAGELRVPWDRLRQVDLQSARIVHVSDLKPVTSEQRSLPGAVWTARPDRNVTGGPLRMAGRAYDKGVGVHAYNSLTYDLGGAFERFTATVGIDDSITSGGSVVFRVKGDHRLLHESKTLRGGHAPDSIAVDVSGVKELILECDIADELDLSDHANWANAILIRTKDAKK